MSRTRTATLLTLALAATLAVPSASAEDAQPETPLKEMVECLLGPFTPTTFVYYFVWNCTAGQYVPEPVGAYSGCRVVFNAQVVCSGGLSDLVFDLTKCRVGFPYMYCQL